MTTTAMMRRRYGSDTVATASPSRLVVMLYDRLVRDLGGAVAALEGRDLETAHRNLLHAQDIVTELSLSLDTERWPEGESLAAIYRFVLDELVQANVHKDARRAASCLEIVEPLRDAWTQAADSGGTP